MKPDLPRRALPPALPNCRSSMATKTRSAAAAAAYEEKLRALNADVERRASARRLEQGVAAKQPFLLAYQGRTTATLQALYGGWFPRIVGAHFTPAPLPPPPRPDEPVRVGIVSSFFHRHSNWKIPIKGWISQLDRSVQDFRLSHRLAARCGDRPRRGDMRPLRSPHARHRRLAPEILADAPHVLIYPGLWMDNCLVPARRAAARAGAVQFLGPPGNQRHGDARLFPSAAI